LANVSQIFLIIRFGDKEDLIQDTSILDEISLGETPLNQYAFATLA
jgi:hypothetical protein